jgi:hypothetical protein
VDVSWFAGPGIINRNKFGRSVARGKLAGVGVFGGSVGVGECVDSKYEQTTHGTNGG